MRRDAAGAWQLTLAERRRILLAHLHGVDIDPEAVAVTRRALTLALLDTTRGGPPPDLDANIRCGNAVIADDYVETAGREAPAPRDVRAFAWRRAFPGVFAAGGFHAVLGNPPYVDAERMARELPGWRAYCAARYRSASGNWDLFCVFIEKALQLARPGGRVGLIVPNKLASADYAAGARALLTGDNTLTLVRDYSAVPVFAAAAYPIVIVAARERPGERAAVRHERMTVGPSGAITCARARSLDHRACFSDPTRPWRMFAADAGAGPLERLRRACRPLAAVATVVGAATVREAYAIQPRISEQRGRAAALRFVNSGLIDRYASSWSQRPCRYLKRTYDRPVVTATAARHLPPKRLAQARAPKLVLAGMTRVLECFVDSAGEWLAGKSTTLVLGGALDLRYLAALLNSRLITYYFLGEYGGNRLQGGYLRIGPPQVRTIPIRVPDLQPGADRAQYDALLGLVDARRAAQTRLQAASPPARSAAASAAADLDAQIDAIVYRLYDISAPEIAAIEAAYRAAADGATTRAPADC